MGGGDVGRALAGILVLALLCWLGLTNSRSGRASVNGVQDEPPQQPYRIYTRSHDLELSAREVPAALLKSSPDRAKGWMTRDQTQWHDNLERSLALPLPDEQQSERLADVLRDQDCAICILIDQSGSMKGDPIIHVAALVRWFAHVLTPIGVPLAVLGFSTVGWQGGKARQDWLSDGRPARPGRLAALLHAVYKPFDAQLADDDWRVLLHPDILRENIDGEALMWAADLLHARPEAKRLLMILSDGAPVDDATLLHNGPNYLGRHLRDVIATIERDSTVSLAAVGINFRVDGFYPCSGSTTCLLDLAPLMVDVVGQAFAKPDT